MFYSKSKHGFFSKEVHGKNIPQDAVEISNKEYQALLIGQEGGFEIVPSELGHPKLEKPLINFSVQETIWRDLELTRADYEINKLQDSDPTAFGTVTEWRAYRKFLRAWPEHKDFPNKDFRPISPDEQE